MKPLIKTLLINKKTKWIYKLRNYPITRAGITANPLEMYNAVSLTTVPNNTLVKHNGLDFVGGDTDIYEYDFFTKVAGSNLECPMKLYYRTSSPTLLVPTDSWAEITTQSDIDKVKTQDGTNPLISTLTNGTIAQMMVEIDLSAIANVVGGNSSLKSLLKSITCDVWTMGSGANGGVSANGVKLCVWRFGGADWGAIYGTSSSSSISKISGGDTTFSYDRVSPSNKIYFLIASQYSSDGVISSSVSLDYLKVTVQLNRVPDSVTPISVNLPKYWGMVVKGFSPNWDSTKSNKNCVLLTIGSDNNNKYVLYWDATKRFGVWKNVGGTGLSLMQTSPTFSKNQVYNFLLCQTSSGVCLYALKNNGTLEKYSNTSISTLLTNQLYIGRELDNTNQADSFLDNLTLIDLEKIGKSSGYTDAEATAILNGTASGFENSELFDINQVQLHQNASRNGGVITLNASAGFQESNIYIPVLPNNRYELKYNINPLTTDTRIRISEYYKNILTKYASVSATGAVPSPITITTGATTNYLKIDLYSAIAGTFTFRQISLKRKD